MKAGYDSYDSFVVYAKTEQEARMICANKGADEQPGPRNCWTQKHKHECDEVHDGWLTEATCEALTSTNLKAKIVIGSFNAG